MDTEDWPDYEFDTQPGKGQTIYILDSGYRRTHEVRGVRIGNVRDICLHRYRTSPQRIALSTNTSFQTLSRFRSLHSSLPTTLWPQKT
jgi:hypothetical protein